MKRTKIIRRNDKNERENGWKILGCGINDKENFRVKFCGYVMNRTRRALRKTRFTSSRQTNF